MKKTRLSRNEVLDLLHEYQSKLKKYEFYIDETLTAIRKLKKSLATAPADEEKPKRRGRKPKSTKAVPRKRGRKAKRGRKPGKKGVAGAAKVSRKLTRKVDVKTKKAKVPKKRGRKPAKKTPRKYKLSNVDNFLIKTLEDRKMALIKSEFIEAVKSSPELITPGSTPGQIEAKVTQSLHKLSNKKKLIAKVKYYGKGFAYALKQWITRKGDLMKVYRR